MKFKSRKFVTAAAQWVALLVVPPVYKLLNIDADITMIVLTSTSAVASIYIGFNAIVAKKKTHE